MYLDEGTALLKMVARELEARAPEEATGSRDFGRGYMHAVRTLQTIIVPS